MEEGLTLLDARDFQAIAGQGIEATIDSKRILLGNKKLMEERNVTLNGMAERAEQLSLEGKTPMFLAVDGEIAGVIAVADTLKGRFKKGG